MPTPVSAVPRRRWGRSELSIPVIPFGTQGFGNMFGPVAEAEATDLVRRAIELGVNHFDCARCYGDSLRKLGPALTGTAARELPRQRAGLPAPRPRRRAAPRAARATPTTGCRRRAPTRSSATSRSS